MSTITILLIVLILACVFGTSWAGPTYYGGGFGLGGLLLVVLIILLITGRL